MWEEVKRTGRERAAVTKREMNKPAREDTLSTAEPGWILRVREAVMGVRPHPPQPSQGLTFIQRWRPFLGNVLSHDTTPGTRKKVPKCLTSTPPPQEPKATFFFYKG